VLVADDSKVVRVKTSRLLAAHGYRVVLAEDGEAALRLIAAELPHVLITDVEMPGIDGFELTRQLRERHDAAETLVIMITSSDVEHAPKAREAGVSILLGKPYPEDQLLAHVASVRSVGT